MEKDFFKKVKTLFSNSKFEDITDGGKELKTDDGRIFRIEGDELKVDIAIKEITQPEEVDEEGTTGIIDIEDGSYTLDDGTILKIEGGMIKEITPAEDTADDTTTATDVEVELNNKLKVINKFSVNAETMAIIKETYVWELEVINTDFKVGDIVKMSYVDEAGETIEYSVCAGTYELEDGRFINTDNEGKVILITDKDGNVLEAPAVGDNVGEEAPAATDTEEGMNAIFESFKIVKSELDSLKEDYTKLKEEYENFKKAPAAKFEKGTGSFKAEGTEKAKNSFIDNSPVRRMFGYGK